MCMCVHAHAHTHIHTYTHVRTPSQKLEWTLLKLEHDRATIMAAATAQCFRNNTCYVMNCVLFRQFQFPLVYPILLGSITTVVKCVLDE